MQNISASEVIELLGLQPHPEGGHYRETFRDTRTIDGRRSASTAIYYLLARGERSHWHRVDAIETWHWYAGDALKLGIAQENGKAEWSLLGNDLLSGQRPQLIVPMNAWQSAECTGAWTLVGCTVAPGFEFSGFELAPRDWSPARHWPTASSR
jgi:uncharacterized protein